MRKPFYMKKVKAWYVWYQGKQIKLDADKEKAFQKYHELMSKELPVENSDTVASLCNLYLDWCKINRSQGTYDSNRYFLSSFIRSVGTSLKINDFKPLHVSNWLTNASTWNSTSKHNAIKCLKRVFNWARKEGRLAINPIRDIEAPSPKRREHAITPTENTLVMSLIRDEEFKDYLTFLYETGARPQEAKIITASHCQIDVERIVLPPSKSKGEEEYRVIYLTPEACNLVRKLCEKNSVGPILRTTKGSAWTKDSVNCRFRRLREKLQKLNQPIKGLCATSWRHGFATEALKKGVDPVTVSILMGHKDTTMVARIYQHLAADASYLTKSLSKVRGKSLMSTENHRSG